MYIIQISAPPKNAWIWLMTQTHARAPVTLLTRRLHSTGTESITPIEARNPFSPLPYRFLLKAFSACTTFIRPILPAHHVDHTTHHVHTHLSCLYPKIDLRSCEPTTIASSTHTTLNQSQSQPQKHTSLTHTSPVIDKTDTVERLPHHRRPTLHKASSAKLQSTSDP